MRLLVYEHLAALGGTDLPGGGSPTLLREGLAMLQVAAEDFSRIDGLEVIVPVAGILDWAPPTPLLRVTTDPARPLDESFREWLMGVDAALIIAPELGGILERLIRLVEASNVVHLGANSSAVGTAADKLLTFFRLHERGVPTIPTWSLFNEGRIDLDEWDEWRTALVNETILIKPRFGAGSQEMSVHHSLPRIEELEKLREASVWLSDAIVQPFIPSRPLSVAVWCSGNDRDYVALPGVDQHLADRCRFEYLGGCMPARGVSLSEERELTDLAIAACRAIPGLKGYVGVDLILPLDETRPPLVCEINPRVTTSYLGYRALSCTNLASQWLRFAPEELTFRDQCVRFHCDGTIDLLS